jgi:pimeloyl-ACP methyl ester carboxylesterase
MKPRTPIECFLIGPQGLPLYTKTLGSPQNPAIVLVHGLLQSSSLFTYQKPLAERFSVITFDLPGHGSSWSTLLQPDPAIILSPELFADSLRFVLQAYALLDRPVVLVACGFGGVIFRNYLLRYGLAPFIGLVLAGAPLDLAKAALHTPSSTVMTPYLSGLASEDASQRLHAWTAFVQLLSATPLDPTDQERLLGICIQAFVQLPLPFFSQLFELQTSTDLSSLYAAITIPTLQLHGQHDALLPLSYAQQLEPALPNSSPPTVHSTAGHCLFLEDPLWFNQQISTFATSCFTHHASLTFIHSALRLYTTEEDDLDEQTAWSEEAGEGERT